MSRRPFHRTLFVAFGAIISVLFLIFGALSLVLAFVVEDGVIDAMLKQQAQQLRHSPNPGAEPLPPGVLWVPEPQQAPTPVAEALAQGPARREIHTDGREHYHVRAIGAGRGWLVAEVRPLLVVSQLSGFWFLVLAVLWALALGFTLWLAYLAARHATQPLRQLLAAYRADPSPELSATSTELAGAQKSGNELLQLAQQLAELQQANRDALRREQAFTRDVSHELRTPLAVLQNQLLLAEQRALTQEDRARMQSAVKNAMHLLENLLALARQEPVPNRPLNLLGQLESAILDAADYAPRLSIDLLCAPDADELQVRASPHRLKLLCKNLIQNAALHGCDHRLAIHLSRDRIRFSNRVGAQPEANPAQLQRRQEQLGEPNASGMHQGLSLSERLAAASGWQLRVEPTSTDSAGKPCFEVTICLSPA